MKRPILIGLFLAVIFAVVGINMVAPSSDKMPRSSTASNPWSVDYDQSQSVTGTARTSRTMSKPRGGQVVLRRADDLHFYANVNLDGTIVHMVVDTGASGIALTRKDAEAIGLNVDSLPFGGIADTAGGQVPFYRTVIARVSIDGVEVRNVDAGVISEGLSISLLGQSYLAKLNEVSIKGDTMTLR